MFNLQERARYSRKKLAGAVYLPCCWLRLR